MGQEAVSVGTSQRRAQYVRRQHERQSSRRNVSANHTSPYVTLRRLAELLKGVKLDVPDGSIQVVDVELKGDSSLSLRRVRRLFCFGELAYITSSA